MAAEKFDWGSLKKPREKKKRKTTASSIVVSLSFPRSVYKEISEVFPEGAQLRNWVYEQLKNKVESERKSA